MKSFHLLMVLGFLWSVYTLNAWSQETVSTDWNVVEIGIGVKPAFDFGTDGKIHVMGMTETGGGVVWHAAAQTIAGPWTPATVADGYFYGPGDLVVDSNGATHMAWHNHVDQDPNHGIVDSQGGIALYRIETPGNHNGWDNSLALDKTGGLYMASVDPNSMGATHSLEFSSFDGNAWSYEAVTGSGAFMYGLNTSIAIDSAGDPHIAYCNSLGWTSDGDLMYATRPGGGAWQISTVATGGIRGRFPSLALDETDRPHLAWLDADSGAPVNQTIQGFVQYGVLNGASWDIEQIDTLDNVTLGSNHARKSASLALDARGRPHVAYADKRDIKIASKAGETWVTSSIVHQEADTYKGLVVLRIRNDGIPGVVFWQDHPTPSEPGLIRFAMGIESIPVTLSSFTVQ